MPKTLSVHAQLSEVRGPRRTITSLLDEVEFSPVDRRRLMEAERLIRAIEDDLQVAIDAEPKAL